MLIQKIANIIKRERESCLHMRKRLTHELQEFPSRGSVVTITQSNKEHVYYSYYCKIKKRSTSVHKGSDLSVIPIIKEQIAKGKKLEAMIKQIDKDIAIIDKVLKILEVYIQKNVNIDTSPSKNKPNEPIL